MKTNTARECKEKSFPEQKGAEMRKMPSKIPSTKSQKGDQIKNATKSVDSIEMKTNSARVCKEKEQQTKMLSPIRRCVVRLARTPIPSNNTSDKEKASDVEVRVHKNKEQTFKKQSLTKIQTDSSNSSYSTKELEVLASTRRNQMKKLSLSNSVRNSTLKAPEITDIDAVLRNGTLKNVLTCVKNAETNEKENLNGEKMNGSSSHCKSKFADKSTQNLTNRSDVIEQLLLSDDELDTDTAIVEASNHNEENNRTIAKSVKFFHHKALDSKANAIVDKTIASKSAKQDLTGKRTRKCKISKSNIYDFLSQDSNVGRKSDPAADIIKKMIEEGKACVTVKCKGRLKIKSVPKKCAAVGAKKPKKKTIAQIESQVDERSNISPPMEHFEFIDKVDACDNQNQLPVEENQIENTNIAVQKNQNLNQSAESGFSHLARSVLLNQASKNYSQRKTVLQKLVSTPVNKKMPPPRQSYNVSPISATLNKPQEHIGSITPWRVDTEAHLPSVFNFNCNSASLPSFSSDFIPPTPRKERKTISRETAQSSLELPDASAIIPTWEEPSCSFSSNDSNAENIPPQKRRPNDDLTENLQFSVDENAQIFDSRQFPNPNRAIEQSRSALKTIHITEVITLPSWKPNLTGATRDKPPQHENCVDQSNNLKLFGFEEFLSDDVDQSEDQNIEGDLKKVTQNTSQSRSGNNQSILGEKLKKLKKFRNSSRTLASSHNQAPLPPVAHIFDENKIQKQRDIKEMLCSTMIKTPQPINLDNNSFDRDYTQDNSLADEVNLFNDPVSSFEEKKSIRTYVRPKRKRKNRNDFVRFEDNNPSSDDEEAELQTCHKNKKRHRKEDKPTVELKKFVHDFNEMCNEVEHYDLMVE